MSKRSQLFWKGQGPRFISVGAASEVEQVQLSLPRLAQLFGLTPFEEQCALICLAPEVDRRYERLYAYLHDDVTRKKASVDLIINLLCNTWPEKLAARRAFEPQAPLMKNRLLQSFDSSPDGPNPLLSRFVKLDDRIVNFLLDFDCTDARLNTTIQSGPSHSSWEQLPVAGAAAARMREFVRHHRSQPQTHLQNWVFYLHGHYGAGKKILAQTVCGDLSLRLLAADVRKMLQGPLTFEDSMWLVGRETMLQPAALCLENFDLLLNDEQRNLSNLNSVFETLETFPCLTFLLGERPWKAQRLPDSRVFLDLELPMPGDSERKHLWQLTFDDRGQKPSGMDIGALASKFRFTPGQMRDAVTAAEDLARWRSSDEGSLEEAEVYAACRAQSSQKLGGPGRARSSRVTSGMTSCFPRTRWINFVRSVCELHLGNKCWANGVSIASCRWARALMRCLPGPRAQAKQWPPK